MESTSSLEIEPAWYAWTSCARSKPSCMNTPLAEADSSPEDAAALRKTGADAVLVGEYLMRAADKKQALDALREAVK